MQDIDTKSMRYFGAQSGEKPDQRLYDRYTSSANYSVKSMEFKSCASGGTESATLNIKDIENVSQVYIRAIIDPDPSQTKKEIDFIFSDMRVVVSFVTFEKLFHFSKKL